MALTQLLTTDSVSANVVNTKIVDKANADISGLQIAQTAGGTGTAITLTGIELTNGYQKTFVISASNSGSATTINGKPLYKPGGTAAPNLTAGKAATVWYNLAGDCFFIKASAEGTAVAGDVLASKTFSNDNDTGLTGTLVLTGDALISDVVIGKTFYNTDAKTELTGTATVESLGGFKSAKLIQSPANVSELGSGTQTIFTLPISGLGFTPKYTIAAIKSNVYFAGGGNTVNYFSPADTTDITNFKKHGATISVVGNTAVATVTATMTDVVDGGCTLTISGSFTTSNNAFNSNTVNIIAFG